MTAKEVATYGIEDKMQEKQRVCEDGVEAVPTTIVEVIELVRDSVEMKRR